MITLGRGAPLKAQIPSSAPNKNYPILLDGSFLLKLYDINDTNGEKVKRLYEKNELAFSIIWIVAYVVLMSLADYFSAFVGIEKVFTLPVGLILATVLLVWIKTAGLSKKYGLVKVKFPTKIYLWFIPLAVTVSVNFWGGVCLRYTLLETVLYVVSMLCVGIVEEIIFRGFLFKVLSKENLVVAIIVSSLTFGFGHIVNLFTGADLVATLLQIGYATAAGFLFTMIFYKSGSLLPCIVTHSVMNATSAFCCDTDLTMEIITAAVLIVVCLAYAFWIWKADKARTKKPNEDAAESEVIEE